MSPVCKFFQGGNKIDPSFYPQEKINREIFILPKFSLVIVTVVIVKIVIVTEVKEVIVTIMMVAVVTVKKDVFKKKYIKFKKLFTP